MSIRSIVSGAVSEAQHFVGKLQRGRQENTAASSTASSTASFATPSSAGGLVRRDLLKIAAGLGAGGALATACTPTTEKKYDLDDPNLETKVLKDFLASQNPNFKEKFRIYVENRNDGAKTYSALLGHNDDPMRLHQKFLSDFEFYRVGGNHLPQVPTGHFEKAFQSFAHLKNTEYKDADEMTLDIFRKGGVLETMFKSAGVYTGPEAYRDPWYWQAWKAADNVLDLTSRWVLLSNHTEVKTPKAERGE